MADTMQHQPPVQQDEPATTSTSAISQLDTVERHWIWKAGIRSIIIVINIVAIGCAAYLIAHKYEAWFFEDFYYSDAVWLEGPALALTVMCVSAVWCLLCVLIPLLVKPRKPIHPGVAVGIDLILWLAFIAAALFALAGAMTYFHPDIDYGFSYENSNYTGNYELESNGTWVYNITRVTPDYSNGQYNITTGEYDYYTPDISSVTRDCTPEFDSCQQKDQLVNKIWHEIPKRRALGIVVDAIAWLDLVLHFTLFVWACVDTHRRNRRKHLSKEKIVADKIIADLEKRGLISVQNGVVTHVAGNPSANTVDAPPPAPVTQPHQYPTSPSMTQSQNYPTFHPSPEPTSSNAFANTAHDPVSPVTREI